MASALNSPHLRPHGPAEQTRQPLAPRRLQPLPPVWAVALSTALRCGAGLLLADGPAGRR